jgi:Flp pilus assembly pilin Flp
MRHRAQDGATSVEYALIATFIAATIAGGVFALGQANAASWQDSCTKITTAMGSDCAP